jgi:hypothetical protein
MGATIDAGNRTGALSLRAFGSNTVIKGATRDPGGSDLGQLPNRYMRPSAKLTVKPISCWLRSNLNGAPGATAFAYLALYPRPSTQAAIAR